MWLSVPVNDAEVRTQRDDERQLVATVPEAPRPVPVGSLSSMFSGYLRAHDAVRPGVLDGEDPAVAGFADLFAGPDPWCPFFL